MSCKLWCPSLIWSCNWTHMHTALGEILQHPKSKLMPADIVVTFNYKLADHLDSYWVVNSFSGATPEHWSELENTSFLISRSSQGGIATLSLTVIATMNKSGTVIFCSSVERVRTHQAVLSLRASHHFLNWSRSADYRKRIPIHDSAFQSCRW